MNLEKALEQFDIVEANLRRLEKVWLEMRSIIPEGIFFLEGSPEGQRYQELSQAYQAIMKGLPPIGSYQIKSEPWELNTIAQARLDAREIDELGAILSVEEGVDAPSREIGEYRFRLNQARRELVREHLVRLMGEIDTLLMTMTARIPSDRQPVTDEGWSKLVNALAQVERLAGSQVPRKGRWQELRRHLAWGQGQDLHDIASLDWPSVRSDIEANLYSELEPLPVEVENLGSLVQSKPSGPVTTKLKWDAISAEDFERLLFNIIADASDYTNPKWLMHTNAPDRGRDISAERVTSDTLSGTKNQRVIIQAKHWQSKSVGVQEVSEAVSQVALWEPPRVHVLVIATSGRFTSDAVAWIEKHNDAGRQPHIEMWPDSHLELLLAQRPHLIAEFNLR
ncbi:restriction endonuclease [Carbonactinospora thermoautotrophica]|uniref:restriction endonuclease n=1 Tax=Carbonactinospora thermoautotrophica TaxID=1469144 RepID=UPI00226ECB55|nr:restriction endonuclease [Carbonactinospora thermoautotrophica]MCX9190315.1 restriction endonuclease [Carbonactinospora thermoautotrophica]